MGLYNSRTSRTGGMEARTGIKDLWEKKHMIHRLWGYLKPYRILLIMTFLLMLAGNVFALLGPMLAGYAVDEIAAGVEAGKVEVGQVLYYAGWMTVLYVVSAVFSYALSVLMISVSKKLVYQMRSDVFAQMLKLPVGYYDTHETGDIISRISYDIDTMNESFSSDIIQMFTTLITIVGALMMMVCISWRLVFVFAVTVPLSAGVTRFITRRTRPLFRARQAGLGQLNGTTEAMVTGQKTIKGYCGEEAIIQQFEQKNCDAAEAYYRAEYYGSIVGPMVNFINNLSLSMISMFGAFLYVLGMMSIGQISSFVLYSRKFSGPLHEMANIISDLQSALAAAERVFALLDEMPESADSKQALVLDQPQIQGAVTFKHVDFSYQPETLILQDISIQVEPGKMIAIVGETGAGKTTLIQLLMRFYDNDQGQICVDGIEVSDITRKSLRKAYAMVLQDTWLFHGTIFENLAYGKKDADLETVMAAAKAAQIHSYIMQLPEGYDTVLSEGGINISQGQKQLLTIARAMLLDSQMVILDEATSSVDTRTEIQIQKAMRSLMAGKTCFVIAHRLSTIRHADQILVMQKGRIVEQGTHVDLIQRDGNYRCLYEAQFR